MLNSKEIVSLPIDDAIMVRESDSGNTEKLIKEHFINIGFRCKLNVDKNKIV